MKDKCPYQVGDNIGVIGDDGIDELFGIVTHISEGKKLSGKWEVQYDVFKQTVQKIGKGTTYV